jgi:gliding motility-associated-like protein
MVLIKILHLMRVLNICFIYVLTILLSFESLQAQVISGSTTVCSDDMVTYRYVNATCSNSLKWHFEGGAVLLAKNDTVRIQFAERGAFNLKVECGTQIDSLSITVGDCSRNVCMGQNLVPNPSFEDFGNCDISTRNFSLTEVVPPWDDFPKYGGRKDGPSSTDYLNLNCKTISEFYKTIGHTGRTGTGFVGGFQLYYVLPASSSDTLHNSREYFATPLRKPLTVGKTYRVRFYTKKIASSVGYNSYEAIDGIGIRFSEEQPYTQFGFTRNKSGTSTWYEYIGKPAQLTSPKQVILEDTTFWTRIEGRFTADKPYKYLMAGNFFSDKTTNAKHFEERTAYVSYYIFDDFSVQEEGSGVDFTWISTDTVLCRGETARLTYQMTADSVFLKNKNTGQMTPLSIKPSFMLELPHLQATTDYELILKKNDCRDTVPFRVVVLPDYNYIVKKTSCFPSDTSTLTQRFQTVTGCDSIVTIKTVLTYQDTSFLNLYTCQTTETNSVLLTLKSTQGCDSFVLKRTSFLPKDTTFLIFNTCFVHDTGTIFNRLVNRFGCDSLVIKWTKLSLFPKIELGEAVNIPIGSHYTLKPLITGDLIKSITWQPSEGLSCSDCLMPDVVLMKSQTYKAQVIGQNGCKNEDEILLKIVEVPYVYVPSAFSPNEDGVNDVLTVYADENRVKMIKRFALFNRWGNKVFEKNNFLPNDEQNGWKGDFDNKMPLKNEVFGYFMEIELHNGQKIVTSGDTTVIR